MGECLSDWLAVQYLQNAPHYFFFVSFSQSSLFPIFFISDINPYKLIISMHATSFQCKRNHYYDYSTIIFMTFPIMPRQELTISIVKFANGLIGHFILFVWSVTVMLAVLIFLWHSNGSIIQLLLFFGLFLFFALTFFLWQSMSNCMHNDDIPWLAFIYTFILLVLRCFWL